MSNPKVVFILGSQRGGTTIFGRLLGEVDGFVFAGAVRRLWLTGTGQTCSCGVPDDRCPLWSEVMTAVLHDGCDATQVGEWQRRYLSNRHSWLGALRLARNERLGRDRPPGLAGYAEVSEQLYHQVAHLTGARVVVDTSKHPNDAVLLSRLKGLDTYVIQIVRDPRGSAYSVLMRFTKRRAEKGVMMSTVAQLGHTTHATLHWLTRHGASEAIRRMVPDDRSLLVRYEDMTEDPAEALGRVAAFVGEEHAGLPAVADGKVELVENHSPSCAKRFPATTMSIRHDSRWLSDLPRRDALVTVALAWPLMLRYGYPLRRPTGRRSPDRRQPHHHSAR